MKLEAAMPSHHLIPQHAQVLIIGGGPGGSYAASVLAREGIDVVILEASQFPRYHVGESLIPSVRHYLRFIGAEEKVANYGFIRKPGSAIKFNQFKREGYTDFVALGHNNNAWNVIRAEFDQILLNHARSCGALVFENTKVTSLKFSDTDPSRPVSATWVRTNKSPAVPPQDQEYFPSTTTKFSPPLTPPHTPTFSQSGFSSQQATGTISFTHVIDASGRAGLISTQYLKNRRFNASLKNVAVWGYWRGTGIYGSGPRKGAPWFEALTDESGWAWYIPLHDGTVSIGVVANQKIHAERNKNRQDQLRSNPSDVPFAELRYLEDLKLAPGVLRLIGTGSLVLKSPVGDTGSTPKQSKVMSASDFSYSAPKYAGSGYRIIGDAGAFIDPFFSSGIHLAMASALSAAATICASLRGDCLEEEAAVWHTKRVATSYTRFQVVVLSAYKQIRAQNINVLSDIDENNYDRAFSFLRPVIQGASDMGARLSETELQSSLDFCVNLFNPTSPEQHRRVASSGDIKKELLEVNRPVMDPSAFEEVLRIRKRSKTCAVLSQSRVVLVDDEEESDTKRDAETRMVLNKINARRVVHAEYAINNVEAEPLNGLVVRLRNGDLGLDRAGSGLGKGLF